MIHRDYRFTLKGSLIYIERFYATYDDANNDLMSICTNSTAVFATIPTEDMMLTARIDELTATEGGYGYIPARTELMFRDISTQPSGETPVKPTESGLKGIISPSTKEDGKKSALEHTAKNITDV